MKKVLGILGGMGPLATKLLYERIIHFTKANCDQEHMDLFIYSMASMPDRTTAIMEGREAEMCNLLLKSCQKLEKMGAELLAIPCNTSHHFLPQVTPSLKVPLIDMVAETVLLVKEKNPKKVAILSTDGTCRSGLYQKKLREANIPYIDLPCFLQEYTTHLIYEEIKKGQLGNLEKFQELESYLIEQEVDCIILACTELSVFRETHQLNPTLYVDALDVLATQCVLQSGANLQENHP